MSDQLKYIQSAIQMMINFCNTNDTENSVLPALKKLNRSIGKAIKNTEICYCGSLMSEIICEYRTFDGKCNNKKRCKLKIKL